MYGDPHKVRAKYVWFPAGNLSGRTVNAVSVQIVINAAMGLGCAAH